MNVVHQHHCRGALHVVTIKRAYSLAADKLVPSPEPPAIVQDALVEEGVLLAEQDTFPRPHFTDVVVQGAIHAPAGRPATSLIAGVQIGKLSRAVLVQGQRHLEVSGSGVRFSQPEPFTQVPFTWQEAYGGMDSINGGAGDIWDIPNLSRAFGQDMSDMNLNRYRRNPLGKGYVLKVTPDHHGFPLPRLEWGHDALTPERLETGDPVNWFFQPSPACFGWVHYAWYPRIAFMGGKLFDKAGAGVPDRPLPEYTFGLDREDLFAQLKPEDLAKHPRVLNGAHPAMQVPSLEGKQPLVLKHFDAVRPQWEIPYEAKPPRVHMETPGERKTYRATARLSQLIIDTEAKHLQETWHAAIRTQAPILGPEAEEKVRYDIRGI